MMAEWFKKMVQIQVAIILYRPRFNPWSGHVFKWKINAEFRNAYIMGLVYISSVNNIICSSSYLVYITCNNRR